MASIFSRKTSFITHLEPLVSPVPDVDLEGAQEELLRLASLLDEAVYRVREDTGDTS
jgi:hypothetical protein